MTAIQTPATPSDWTDSADAAFRDAYLDWAETLRARRAPPAGAERYEPIFVRLVDAGQKAALAALVDDPASPLRMDAHERGFLTDRLAQTAPFDRFEDCYALYRRFGTPDDRYQAVFSVIDTGGPVALRATGVASAPAVLPPSDVPGAPIVAVIDDAIGFLNARFRRGARSRLHGIWLQALESDDGTAGGVTAGAVLDRDAIDALLALPDEDAAYGRAYDGVFTTQAASGLWRSVWHGTHVLDLAGGADDGDAAQDWPLLAVQLPPEAIEDTSGMRAESYLVQGLRWILRSARQIDRTAPVIVNLSLGIVAGPKDGTRFAEWQVAREAAQWEDATGQKVRIVWAFGNAYRDGQVAGFDYAAVQGRADPERSLTWRVQPEDHSANYCELRTHGADSTAVQVALTAPDGTASGFQPIAPGQHRSLLRGGKAIARIYHVPDKPLAQGRVSPAHYVLVTAPTEAHDLSLPRSAAGAWRIGLRHEGDAALHVSLQIQRDDALRGNRGKARQSYFDDPGAHAWDEVWQQYTGLSADGPLRHEGTHSAFASALGRQILTVGAARRDLRQGGWVAQDYRPADYTGQGADWAASGPTLSVPVDAGPFQPGVLGAGRTSGSVRFSNGTSAAAARLTRALALSAAKITRSGGQDAPSDDLNRTAVRMIAVDPSQASRLGGFVVEMPDENAARR